MKTLEELRKELDGIDSELMRLYSERMEVSKEIGRLKRREGLPVEVPEREKEVAASRVGWLPEELREGGERLVRLLMEGSKKVQRQGANLYLIGMPDCGKTRMGKKLKERLKLPLADTDKLIMQKLGVTIDGIFERFGEEGFREMETRLLHSIAERGGMIVATGGGMPIWGDNPRLMKYSGVTVFLDRSLEKLHGQNTVNRPLLAADSEEEVNANIDRLYRERHDKYLAAADITVDPDSEGTAERIAEAYLRWIENGIL